MSVLQKCVSSNSSISDLVLCYNGKAGDDGPVYLGSCTHMGNPDEAPGSYLHPGTSLAIAVICEVNQQMKCLYKSVFPPCSVTHDLK